MTDPREQEWLLRSLIDGKLDGLMILLAERDRRYQERFEATEKASSAALAATARAIDKAEAAQQLKNEALNEARGEIRDRASSLIERSEVESLVRELRALAATNRNDIAKLREVQSGILVQQATLEKVDDNRMSHIAIALSFSVGALGALAGVGGLIVAILFH